MSALSPAARVALAACRDAGRLDRLARGWIPPAGEARILPVTVRALARRGLLCVGKHCNGRPYARLTYHGACVARGLAGREIAP